MEAADAEITAFYGAVYPAYAASPEPRNQHDASFLRDSSSPSRRNSPGTGCCRLEGIADYRISYSQSYRYDLRHTGRLPRKSCAFLITPRLAVGKNPELAFSCVPGLGFEPRQDMPADLQSALVGLLSTLASAIQLSCG